MPITTLLKSMHDFLAKEGAFDCQGNGSSKNQQPRTQLDAPAAKLEFELGADSEERSRPGMVKSILVAVDASD